MRISLLCFAVLLGGCASKVPVTFNGQQFDEYLYVVDSTHNLDDPTQSS